MEKYQVRSPNSGDIIITTGVLSEAVIKAAWHDGYGATFERDVKGHMRLYRSKKHIGNNEYLPLDTDALLAHSTNHNDETAIDEVAEEIFKTGNLHAKLNVEIVVLGFEDDVLLSVDGEKVEQLAENADMSVADYRAIFVQ